MDIGEHVEIRQLRAAGKPLIGQKAPPAWARKLATMFVAASLALPILARPASVLAADPEDSVRNLYDALLGTMKEGRVLGESGRYARIEPVVHRLFDIPWFGWPSGLLGPLFLQPSSNR